MKKRFPTLSHLCEVGVVTENEARIIQSVDDKCIGNKHFEEFSEAAQDKIF